MRHFRRLRPRIWSHLFLINLTLLQVSSRGLFHSGKRTNVRRLTCSRRTWPLPLSHTTTRWLPRLRWTSRIQDHGLQFGAKFIYSRRPFFEYKTWSYKREKPVAMWWGLTALKFSFTWVWHKGPQDPTNMKKVYFCHILCLNLNNSYQITSLFDMYIDMGEMIVGKQDRRVTNLGWFGQSHTKSSVWLHGQLLLLKSLVRSLPVTLYTFYTILNMLSEWFKPTRSGSMVLSGHGKWLCSYIPRQLGSRTLVAYTFYTIINMLSEWFKPTRSGSIVLFGHGKWICSYIPRQLGSRTLVAGLWSGRVRGRTRSEYGYLLKSNKSTRSCTLG